MASARGGAGEAQAYLYCVWLWGVSIMVGAAVLMGSGAHCVGSGGFVGRNWDVKDVVRVGEGCLVEIPSCGKICMLCRSSVCYHWTGWSAGGLGGGGGGGLFYRRRSFGQALGGWSHAVWLISSYFRVRVFLVVGIVVCNGRDY